MRRPQTRPVPLSYSLGLGGGVFLLVLLGTLPVTKWPYNDWVAVSATTRECLVYVAPWAAAWCAWVAGRYLGSRSMLCLPSARRSGTYIVLAQLRLLLGSVLIGYLLGLIPVLVITWVGATQGRLDWIVLVGAITVLLMFCSLGYLIGCMVGRLSSIILAVATSFGVILLVDTWGPVVAPLRLDLISAGWNETTIVSLFRVVFFGALTLSLVIAAAFVVDRRTTRRTPAGYTGLLVILIPLLFGVAARSAAPAVALPEQNPPLQCTAIRSGQVCVHAAKAVLLPTLADTVNRVLLVVDGRPAVPVSTVLDAAAARGSRSDALILNLEPNQDTWIDWAASDIAQYISGLAACRQSGSSTGTAATKSLDRDDVATGISAWITSSAGFDTALLDNNEASDKTAQVFEQLPASEARHLYHRFASEIASCELPSSSLP